MFKENATQKLIEYIQTLPMHDRQVIAERILEPKIKKHTDKKASAKRKVLDDIKEGLAEIKEAKSSKKKLKNIDTFLNEI